MESINSEKGYSDEQWEALLNQTFGDPAPAPKAPEPKPEAPEQKTPDPDTRKPETAEKDTPTPAKPVTTKKRKVPKVLWILLAVSLVLAIIALHVFPRNEDDTAAITEEQKQCMEALRQWQEAQYYKVSISTTIISHDSYASGYIPITETAYYHGDKCELNWAYARYGTINSGSQFNNYTGEAVIDGKQYTYSNGGLNTSYWNTTDKQLDISQPWILSFSLNDVKIIDQHTYKAYGEINVVSFSVMDLDPEDTYYDQGPYRINFHFDAEGQLYGVTHYHSHYTTNELTTTTFYLTEMSAELVERCVKTQISNPTAYPGLFFDSVVVPDINITVEE